MKITYTLLFLGFFFVGLGQKYDAVDAHARTIKFDRDYKSVAQALVLPFDDEESKARSIFTWIAENLKYDNKRLAEFRETGKRTKTKYTFRNEEEKLQAEREMFDGFIEKALKEKKGVCQEFALLYEAMCREVGLEAAFIVGFGRFSNNNIGKVHKASNHAWNAVKIDDQWTLLDVTWSTGMGEEKDYGNGFFMVDPSSFILSHYPDDAKWQLLETNFTKKEFANAPFPYYSFIKHNGELLKPLNGKVSKDGIISIRLDLEEGQGVHLIRGKKPTNLKPKIEGNVYTFDLSKITIRGDATIGVSQGRKVKPIIAFKVR